VIAVSNFVCVCTGRSMAEGEERVGPLRSRAVRRVMEVQEGLGDVVEEVGMEVTAILDDVVARTGVSETNVESSTSGTSFSAEVSDKPAISIGLPESSGSVSSGREEPVNPRLSRDVGTDPIVDTGRELLDLVGLMPVRFREIWVLLCTITADLIREEGRGARGVDVLINEFVLANPHMNPDLIEGLFSLARRLGQMWVGRVE